MTGSSTGAFQFIKEIGYIPYETCQPYMACSSDSDEELCKYIDTTCTSKNICKTCTRNASGVGVCNQVRKFRFKVQNWKSRSVGVRGKLSRCINFSCALFFFM